MPPATDGPFLSQVRPARSTLFIGALSSLFNGLNVYVPRKPLYKVRVAVGKVSSLVLSVMVKVAAAVVSVATFAVRRIQWHLMRDAWLINPVVVVACSEFHRADSLQFPSECAA